VQNSVSRFDFKFNLYRYMKERESSIGSLTEELLAAREAAVEAEREMNLARDAASEAAADRSRFEAELREARRERDAAAAAAASAATATTTAAAAAAAADRLSESGAPDAAAEDDPSVPGVSALGSPGFMSPRDGMGSRERQVRGERERDELRLVIREAQGTIEGLERDVARADAVAAVADKAHDDAESKLETTERELSVARGELVEVREVGL
jgi:chromosome segregation ATPase